MTREFKCKVSFSCLQASFWMSLCVFMGFAAVYLQSLGYSNARLGIILACGTLLGSLIGPELSAVIDRSTEDHITASSVMTPVIASEMAAAAVLLAFPVKGIITSAAFIVYIAVSTCVNSLVLKLYTDSEYYGMGIDYGISRSMGSLGYVITSVIVGALCESFSARAVPAAGLAICIFQYISFRAFSGHLNAARAAFSSETAAHAAAGHSEAEAHATAEHSEAGTEAASGSQASHGRGGIADFLIRNKRFCLLLAGSILVFYAHNTLCNFFINVVRNAGGDTGDMGFLNGLMALIEVPVIFFYTRITKGRRTSNVLRLSFILFTAKAAAVAAAGSVTAIAASLLLQAPSFGLYTGAIVLYTDETIAREDSAKAQSLAFTVTMLGSVFASTISGRLFDVMPVSSVMWIAAAVSLAGSILAACGVTSSSDK